MTPESRTEQKSIVTWLASNGIVHVIRNWLKVHFKYRDRLQEMSDSTSNKILLPGRSSPRGVNCFTGKRTSKEKP